MNSSDNAGEGTSGRRASRTTVPNMETSDPESEIEAGDAASPAAATNGVGTEAALDGAPAIQQEAEQELVPADSMPEGDESVTMTALSEAEPVAEMQATDVAASVDPAVDSPAEVGEGLGAEETEGTVTGEVEGETIAEDLSGAATGEQDGSDKSEGEGAEAEDEKEELIPLAVNAIVAGKYLVQSQLHASPDRNLYRVVARQQQRCATCGRLSDAEAENCGACGADLDGQQPAAEFYLMAESFRPEALVQDPVLMTRNLYHPNLVPVVDFFSYKPYGRTRYFAVAEPRGGVRLSQLSLPRPATQTLTWAMQLADALAYLHEQGVVGAGAEADDILVHGDRASLASLQNAHAATEEGDSDQEQRSMDLARLAGTIYEAYTGTAATLTPDGVLPVPAGAPEQMSAAFRAAIEPVQGTARAITVVHWREMLVAAFNAMTELERPSRPVSFLSGHHTSVGRLREQNQDSYGMIEFVQASEERPFYIGLYVVADGLGGHKGGEIASAIATQTFCGDIMSRVMAAQIGLPGERPSPSSEAILQAMTQAIQAANDRIYKARNSRQNDMGTTMVATLIAGGKAYVANVGDSRLYILSRTEEEVEETGALDATRPLAVGTMPLDANFYLQNRGELADGTPPDSLPIDRSEGYELQQVSVDHSLVHRLVELGQLDAEEAKVHPHRNFIYRSLGGQPPIEVDTFVRTLKPGDRILLCSDGLNSMVEDEEIAATLRTEQAPVDACRRLVALANEAGGHDNITTIVVDVLDYLPYTEPL